MNSLIQLLISCEVLLRSVGENFWAGKIKTIIQKGSSELDMYRLEEILSWYGGMGSFNDLIISVHNDHKLNGQDEKKLNDELSKIRSDIYQEATLQKKTQ